MLVFIQALQYMPRVQASLEYIDGRQSRDIPYTDMNPLGLLGARSILRPGLPSHHFQVYVNTMRLHRAFGDLLSEAMALLTMLPPHLVGELLPPADLLRLQGFKQLWLCCWIYPLENEHSVWSNL